ncbi:MAG: M24 family metallopeptidase [Candidatus Dormibacterales bacterium]
MSKPATATRLDELRGWLAGSHLEAAYVTKPVSIAYLTGFQAEPFERLMALVVRPAGATLIVPALEREKASAHSDQAEVASWRDGEDAYALVRDALAGCAAIGVEKDSLTVGSAEALTDRTGVRRMSDMSPELKRLRRTKNPAEIEKLVRAAAITDSAGEAVMARLAPGLTELAIATMLGAVIGEMGGTLSFESLVQSGPNSSLPHLRPTNRQLQSGDFVLLDFGAAFEGYHGDTARMAVIGEPSQRHREIHQLVLDAHDAAIAAVRAGVTAVSIDAAARRVIEAKGYGDRFFHRVGHGLGLEAHEDPSVDPGSATVLESGMVFTVEPGIYIPGWGGVRIEDDVVVEPDGCRVLTQSDRALRVIEK